jgi:hypothetical protein
MQCEPISRFAGRRRDNATARTRDRRGLPVIMAPAKPYCREEKEFIKAFANALNHATAVVAADPETSMPVGSIADHVRRAYLRFRPDRHSAIQQRARERLSGSTEQRAQYFGTYSQLGAEAWSHAEPGLGSNLKEQLRRAVAARLDAQRQDIAAMLGVGAAANFLGAQFLPSKTTLKIGYFGGDAANSWTALTITSPASYDFLWETNAANAERGTWQLFQVGQSGKKEILLGSGIAGNAPGGIFTINLANYLASTPPAVPAVYRIRVTPGTKPKTVPGPAEGEVIQIPGKPVGPPSNDVVITYSSIVAPNVEFEIFEIYQTATFMLESIYMVEDQNGSGAEEFHVAGFVQESFPISSSELGQQKKFGPVFAQLDIDGPRSKSLAQAEDFFLSNPSTPEWPRVYSVVISVLEEDDGGSLNDWESSIWTVADEMASGEIGQAISDYLEENFKEYIGDNLGNLIHEGAEFAQMLGSLIASTTAGVISMVIAAAALVISDIISGMSDDYYGTEAFILVLPTNITDYVHSLPGQPIAGGFQLDSESLEFKGYTSWPEASAFDGIVDVFFHWEFSNKGQS